MDILLFEDAQVAQLLPLTWTRPAFTLPIGGWTLLDLSRELGLPVFSHVRPFLQTLQQVDYGIEPIPATNHQGCLALNSRLLPTVELLVELQRAVSAAKPALVMAENEIAYAFLPRSLPVLPSLADVELASLVTSQGGQVQQVPATGRLLQWPHEVVAANQRMLVENLDYRLRSGRYHEIRDGVFVAAGVRFVEPVVTDCRLGPIVLDKDVEVNAFTQLTGPIYVGPHAQIQPHSCIVGPVAVGERVKLGGEVESSVVDSRSNKKHFGYLGHSYLGSWVNLGAGTVTGNLKHTYGEIRMRYADRTVATAMQFLGTIMADYSRTSINTGIYTGRSVGVCSLLFGTVSDHVGSFTNFGAPTGQLTEVSLDVAIRMQERMFARRGIVAQAGHRELLQHIFQQTQDDRPG
ncbi:MAG: putative sugar nucleotidyl transferase [Planctomycetota bacterium]|nr:putative sugar nucleotidyl transferase [Planctomycetota bacterium]MDA1180584.1 putative sugar nucleotidyl transferase [Planctomycetota bacterium]